jgi:hypothetical protein
MAADTATYLLTFGLLALIAVKVLSRRNWARWVLAVVVGMGVVAAILSILVVPALWGSASLALYGFGLFQTALQLYALRLVFTREANTWFATRHAVA